MKYIYPIAAMLFLSTIAFGGQSFDTDKPWQGKVSLSIDGDEKIKGQVESFVSRELRSLGDIVLTETNPDWEIRILAGMDTNKTGDNIGFSLSVILSVPMPVFILEDISSRMTSEEKAFKFNTVELIKDYKEIKAHFLQGGAEDDLKSSCTKLIAEIDSEFFSPVRANDIKIKKMMNEKESGKK